MAMVFWIFSYNRGEFLRNCVKSIEDCAPGNAIRIFDDHSSDAETRALLAQLAQRYPVHSPQPKKNGGTKHGGLYANMQAAFEACADDELVCFLQDDTQLVRPVEAAEFVRMREYLAHHGPCFIQGAFLRGSNKKRDRSLTRFDPDKRVYFVDRLQRAAGAFYSDICIFHTGALRAAEWRFIPRESCNEEMARKKLRQMAYWPYPFAAWLPYVPAFRGKTQTFALRWAQKIRRCGFYPIHYLSADENRAFLARDIDCLPYAEDFLSTDVPLPQPWIYYPLQGKSWLKQLNAIELKIRKWGSR